MASIIPGYEYDVFISYRQKDNKHDGWVTEFVNNLKGELESTFKEEISVYFDINPHDGLLETHDVVASLKDKIKCLVFIPIISRTYCDPKSFAWEHEFKAFMEQASQDQFGLKVKLPNGNVTNRVLPIRIHDLDNEDVKCFEGITEGIMRTLDFVFKTASGVNRTLKSKEDHPNDNLNKTYYQDQINKAALAIKEIIQGMKAKPAQVVKEKYQAEESFKEVREREGIIDLQNRSKSRRSKWISTIAVVALLIIAGIILYPKLVNKNALDKLRSSGKRISIAIMPFQNLTNDTIEWNVYQEIIQNSLTSYLSNFSKDLQVRQTESINNLLNSKGLTNYASLTPSFARKISQTLNADVFISGNIIKSGDVIRLSAQLTDTKTEEIIKPFQIEGQSYEKNFLPKIDSLSRMVKDFLIISKLERESGNEQISDIYFQSLTNSPEAYKYFIYAMKAGDNSTMRNWLYKALTVDSTFFTAAYWILQSFNSQRLYDQAKEWCLKLYKKKDQLPPLQQLMINSSYARLFQTQIEQNKYLLEILKIDDQQPLTYYILGNNYYDMGESDKAIPLLEKSLELYEKWGLKPSWLPTTNYSQLARSYHKTGQYEKAKKLFKKADQDFPDNSTIKYWQAIFALKEGKSKEADRYIEKYKSILKVNSASEVEIVFGLAQIYSWAGIPDKAKEYCRSLLSFKSVNPSWLIELSWVMAEDDRTLNECVELANRVLESNPDNYQALHRKGWAFYKQGKYTEALELLQRSWDIRMKNAIYNHETYIHLEEAKKAIANQK